MLGAPRRGFGSRNQPATVPAALSSAPSEMALLMVAPEKQVSLQYHPTSWP